MTVCTVCGEEDFEEQGGHFYCTTCNTQSQNFRVMVADEEDANWLGFAHVIKEKKSQENKQPKAVADLGRPWSIYEAFQIVLQHQVEALIKLGANPCLRDMVFKLWRNYLSRLGVAFSNGPLVEELQKYERQREKFPGTLKNPRTKNVLGSNRRRQKLGPPVKQAEKQMMMDAVQGEEFYEGDNPVDAIGAGDKNEDEYSSEEETDIKLWGSRRASLKTGSLYKMTMSRTLALCYLGLMYTNPLTTLSDIIRWAKTYKIPFRNITPLLPADMKFALTDWMLFGMDMVPNVETLSAHTGAIAYFLGLQNIPEFPLSQLISKYLLQLCLPGEMHGVVMKLMMMDNISKCYIPKKVAKRIPFWEGYAMAYILVTLKMLFGLNNHMERLLSEYTRELMQMNPAGERLFVFNDWITYMRKGFNISEMNFQQANEGVLTEGEPVRSNDAVTYTERRRRLYNSSTRDKLQAPFLEMSKHLKTRQSHVNETQNQSSIESTLDIEFDLSSNTLLADDPVGYLLGQYDTENQEDSQNTQGGHDARQKRRVQELKQSGEEFRRSSVEHVISPDQYLNRLENKQVIDDTIYSSSVSIADSTSEAESGTDDDSSVYSSARKKRKRSRKSETQSKKRRKLSVKQSVEFHDSAEPKMSKVMDRSRYQYVCDQIKHLHEHFQLNLDSERDTALTSYYGLVEICAQVIGCPREQIQNEVRKIEVKHFAEVSDMSKGGKHNFKKLQRSRFATQRMKKF